MYTTARGVIKTEGAFLGVGESVRISCPFCGAEHEKSCCITANEQGLLYVCHRAQCGARGFVSALPSGEDYVRKKERKKELKPYGYPRQKGLPEDVARAFAGKFGLELQSLGGLGLDFTDSGRIILPVLDYRGYTCGEIARAWPEWYRGVYRKRAKAIYYPMREGHSVHWPRGCAQRIHDTGGSVTLVEDYVSCIRLAEHVPCIALLGTAVDNATRADLQRLGVRKVTILLDNDATVQASKLRRELALFFDSVEVVVPPCDPKDMTDEQFDELLGRLNARTEDTRSGAA